MTARAARTAAACVVGTLIWALGAAGASAQGESHEEAIGLSWDGSGFSATTTERFITAPVAVPGDSARRTITVRNSGALEGTLTAAIVNVSLLDPDSADVHHREQHTAPDDSGDYAGAGDQGDFYDDLRISWLDGDASASDLLANGETPLLSVALAPGETVPLTIGYELPFEATSGNQANVDPRLVTFDVRLELGGALPSEPAAPAPSAAQPASASSLPRTGAAEFGWLAVIAGLLAGGGAALAIRRQGARTRP